MVAAPGPAVQDAQPGPTGTSAVPLKALLAFFSIAGLGCALDLATKQWIFNTLGMPGGRTWWLIGEYVGLQTSLNEGALFGIGQGQVTLFASLSFVAAAGILYWLFVVGGARDLWLTVALGAIMAGILGNLYDRLGLWTVAGFPDLHHHAVRDWILLQYGVWKWPNFNIADSLLVCGAAMIIWSAAFPGPSAPTSDD